MPSAEQLLHIYLRDHLTGATGGRELARRIAGSYRDRPEAAELDRFAQEVDEDRDALLQIMSTVGARPDPVKTVLAVVGERLGRLKLNGSLFQRSALSNVVELEFMGLGVEGKASGWRTLRTLAADDDRLDAQQLDRLLDRAQAQRELLEGLRVAAARSAFTSPGTPGS